MGKVIFAKANRLLAVREAPVGAKPRLDRSKPLANVKHERFCWAIVQGHRLGLAYEIAGFGGKSPRLPWQLRHKPSVDARINWLLAKRIEDDTKAHHKAERKISDTRERVIRELERLAFNDVRNLVQWGRKPVYDEDGQVVGFVDDMTVRPSHLMTPEQAASVRSVTTKSGTLKFEMHDKLGALEKLAKVLGLYVEPVAPAFVSQSVTVNQLNVNDDNALEAARRLAFALAKLSHTGTPGQLIEAHGVGGDPKK